MHELFEVLTLAFTEVVKRRIHELGWVDASIIETEWPLDEIVQGERMPNYDLLCGLEWYRIESLVTLQGDGVLDFDFEWA
jgi:hypothetical protein